MTEIAEIATAYIKRAYQKGINVLTMEDTAYLSDDDEKGKLCKIAEDIVSYDPQAMELEEDSEDSLDEDDTLFRVSDSDTDSKRKTPSRTGSSNRGRGRPRLPQNINKKVKPVEERQKDKIDNMRKPKSNTQRLKKEMKRLQSLNGSFPIDMSGNNSPSKMAFLDNDRETLKMNQEMIDAAFSDKSSAHTKIVDSNGSNMIIASSSPYYVGNIQRPAYAHEIGMNVIVQNPNVPNAPPRTGTENGAANLQNVINK